jgi:hypothetical protein
MPAERSPGPGAGRGVTRNTQHALLSAVLPWLIVLASVAPAYGLWAEHTRRLTCQAPAACTERRQRSAPPYLYLPGASRLYGEEAKELAPAPVGLARHRTKWQVAL